MEMTMIDAIVSMAIASKLSEEYNQDFKTIWNLMSLYETQEQIREHLQKLTNGKKEEIL